MWIYSQELNKLKWILLGLIWGKWDLVEVGNSWEKVAWIFFGSFLISQATTKRTFYEQTMVALLIRGNNKKTIKLSKISRKISRKWTFCYLFWLNKFNPKKFERTSKEYFFSNEIWSFNNFCTDFDFEITNWKMQKIKNLNFLVKIFLN